MKKRKNTTVSFVTSFSFFVGTLLLHACVLAMNPDETYRHARKLFNDGEYDQALRILEKQFPTTSIPDNPSTLECQALELKINCYKKKRFYYQTIETTSKILSEAKTFPGDWKERFSWLSGDCQKYFGYYTLALKQYQKVVDEFKKGYYVGQAKEGMEEINRQQVAELRGQVDCPNPGQCRIYGFNGLETFEAELDRHGSYNLPIYNSTLGTYVVLTVRCLGYVPVRKLWKMIDGKGATCPAITCRTPLKSNLTQGLVMGCFYEMALGGRRVRVYGIHSLAGNKKATLFKTPRTIVTSDEDGFFAYPVETGKYITTYEEPIDIRKTEVLMININVNTIKVD